MKLAELYKRLLEQTRPTDLDKRFKNTNADLNIKSEENLIPDNTGPWATTGTSIDRYLVTSSSKRKYSSDEILDWAKTIWKSSYLIDKTIQDVKVSGSKIYITVKTVVWYN